MEETVGNEAKTETALIEQQKKITVTGVVSVDAFSPGEIRVTLESGKALVSGDGLKIVSFSKSSGNFSAVGKIAGIRFFGKNEKLVRRLFG